MSAVLRYELLYWLIDLQGVSACVSQSATQNSMVSTKSDQKFARVPFNWSSTPSYYHLQYYPCISASPGSGLLCKLRPSGMDLQEAWRDLVVMTWHQHGGSLSALKSHAPGSRNLGHTLAIPQAANTSSKAGQRVVQQSCLPILVQKMVGPLYARGCTTTFPARNGLLANLRSMADEFCAGKKLRCMRRGTWIPMIPTASTRKLHGDGRVWLLWGSNMVKRSDVMLFYGGFLRRTQGWHEPVTTPKYMDDMVGPMYFRRPPNVGYRLTGMLWLMSCSPDTKPFPCIRWYKIPT
jgi:hypothetical protein